jgi:phage baseplate assembly protein W
MAVTPQPIGITFPIADGDGGYFRQSFDVVSQIKTNLFALFNTKKGERRMNLKFGSDLWSLLFEFNNDDSEQIIDSTVRRDVLTWMPYVNVQQVGVSNGTDHAMIISIAFTVPSAGITSAQLLKISMQQGHE